MTLEEIKVVLIIVLMLLLPGWAMLAMTGYWKKWQPVQRWLLAMTLSIAFWPILYYASREIFPIMRIGTNKLIVILFLSLVIIIWKLKGNWKEQFKFEQTDFAVLFILILTLFSRFIMIDKYPYPSWTDSLHHTLITDITATTGKLPYTLAPYETTPLSEYHLGLYALTAPLQLLANLPAHSALLWMAQFLNGICGIGVFLFLDKKVSRTAGLVGMVTAGLLSFQPAIYFSWGRFTQLGGQAILLQAALIFWQVIEDWKDNRSVTDWDNLAGLFLAALVCAAMALIHFRVAAFAIPLLLTIFVWEIFRPNKSRSYRKHVLFSTIIIFLFALILILPALIPALAGYLAPNDAIEASLMRDVGGSYFGGFTWKTFFSLGLHKWLAILSFLGFVAGFLRPKTRLLSIFMALWCLALLGEGYLYQTGIAHLAFTNLTGIMIMAYLPAGVFVGIFIDVIQDYAAKYKFDIQLPLIGLALLAGVIASYDRVDQFEEYRYFMTEGDEVAMRWINKNTSPDSLFGINTYFWLPDAAHGSDGGYWLPYFSGRRTTTGVMISNYNTNYETILKRDNAIVNLYSNPTQLDALCELGVDYLYSGAKDPFNGMDFDITQLDMLPETELIYDSAGVQVLKICGK
jgi:hypothetical protein